jgi:alanine racemase
MPPLATEMEAAVEHDLTVTFTRTAQVMEMRREGERQGKVGSGHVYEDLGLGRLGPSENIMDIIAAADPWSEVHVKGVYTHFGPPRSGVDLDSFEWVTAGATLRVYASMLHDAMRQFTDRRMLLHVAASAMLLEDPMSHFDMVRVGTLLYGQYPEHVPAGKRDLDLLDTFELRSHIVEVHEVRKGARIGYGGEFVCARPTRVATVPVGFAHGLGTVPESVSGRPRSFLKALLRARDSRRGRAGSLPSARLDAGRAPLIGRISMDQCALDVTDLPDVDRGTEVVLPVRRLAVPASIPRVYLP